MDAINSGEIPLNPTTVSHFDSCLGCLACVTACPSGVQYDKLIEATRGQVQRQHPRSWQEKLIRGLIFALFPYPERLRPLLYPVVLAQKLGIQSLIRRSGWLNRLHPSLAAMESIFPSLDWQQLQPPRFPVVIPAQGDKRYRVGVILGCVQRLFAPQVNEATISVLTANGCEVVIPREQGCCGALPHHQGVESQAQMLARQMINCFLEADVDAVLINASGCGHTLKEYGRLLAEDPDYAEKAKQFAAKVKDVQEFLVNVGLTTPLHPLKEGSLTLVYQDACHMLHGQRISLQPRQLLRQIPGVILKEPVDAALCCGSSGVYNLLQPQVGEELGQQKVRNLLNTKAEMIISSNIGCRVQIQKHLGLQGLEDFPLLHPMELLDRSIHQEHLAKSSACKAEA
jgi:glycolate oxidase iron-sulfur subunit